MEKRDLRGFLPTVGRIVYASSTGAFIRRDSPFYDKGRASKRGMPAK